MATGLISEEKRVIFTHCYQSKVCCEAMEIAFEVCKLIKFSPKRNAAFNKIKAGEAEDDSISGIGIRSLCPTR